MRKERKISQEDLAGEAGIDRTRMGEIERGEANPTIDTLSKVAIVLGQTLGSLILEAEEFTSGTPQKLRENSVYLDPEYASQWLKNIVQARKQARSL